MTEPSPSVFLLALRRRLLPGAIGGRPSLIFSVSHLADESLALSLLIDSKTVSTRSATLSVVFLSAPATVA